MYDSAVTLRTHGEIKEGDNTELVFTKVRNFLYTGKHSVFLACRNYHHRLSSSLKILLIITLYSLHVRFKLLLNTLLVQRMSLCRAQFRNPTFDSSTSQSFSIARIRSSQTLGLINSEGLSTMYRLDISAFPGKIRSNSFGGTNRRDTPYTWRAQALPVYSTVSTRTGWQPAKNGPWRSRIKIPPTENEPARRLTVRCGSTRRG